MPPGDRDMEGHGGEGNRGDRDKNRGGDRDRDSRRDRDDTKEDETTADLNALEKDGQQTVEVPQTMYIDGIVDVSAVSQREVPVKKQAQKIVVDVPAVWRRQAPMIQKVLKTVEVPQLQYIDEIIDEPNVAQRRVPTI